MTTPISNIPSDNSNSNPVKFSLAQNASSPVEKREKKLPLPISTSIDIHQGDSHRIFQGKLSSFSESEIAMALEQEKFGVEKLINAATSLESQPAVSTQQIVDKISQGMIDKIIQEGTLQMHAAEALAAVDVPLVDNKTDLATQLNPIIIEESFIRECPGLEIAVIGLNVLSRGTVLFTYAMLLNKIDEAISAKESLWEKVVNESEKKVLHLEIKILKKWAEVRHSLISASMQNAGIQLVTSSPKFFSAIISLAHLTKTALDTAVGWIGLGIGLIGPALDLHFSVKNADTHAVWSNMIGIKGEGSSVEDAKLRKKNVEDIIERQKKVYDKRLESNKPALAKLLSSVLHDLSSVTDETEPPSREILDKLDAAGIIHSETDVEMTESGNILIKNEKYPTVKELRDYLSDPEKNGELNQMMVQKKEMLSVSLRKGLLAFNQKKDQIDKGFLQFDIHRAAGMLTIASILTGVVVVLKVLLVAGIIASSVAASSVGYGIFAVAVGLMILGAVYLYYKKPNIFKTYLQGVQIRLLFLKIPLAIQTFRNHYARLGEMRVSDQVREISGRVFEAEKLLNADKKDIESFLNMRLPNRKASGLDPEIILNNYIKRLKKTEVTKLKEAESLREKISGLNESISYFEDKVKPLQERVDIAGWKDFQRSLKGKLAGTSEDDAEILAEYLLQDATLLEDSETRKLLLHMDIDLNTLAEQDPVVMKEKVKGAIRAFFAMETGDTVGMIEKQNLLEKYGLRENIADS